MNNFSNKSNHELDREVLVRMGWKVESRPSPVPLTIDDSNAVEEVDEMLYALISPTGEVVTSGRITEDGAWYHAPRPCEDINFALTMVTQLIEASPDTQVEINATIVRVTVTLTTRKGESTIWSDDLSDFARALVEAWAAVA